MVSCSTDAFAATREIGSLWLIPTERRPAPSSSATSRCRLPTPFPGGPRNEFHVPNWSASCCTTSQRHFSELIRPATAVVMLCPATTLLLPTPSWVLMAPNRGGLLRLPAVQQELLTFNLTPVNQHGLASIDPSVIRISSTCMEEESQERACREGASGLFSRLRRWWKAASTDQKKQI
jgi:hypothetical protein